MNRSTPASSDDARRRPSPARTGEGRAPVPPQRPRAPLEVALDTAGLRIISLDDYADGADSAGSAAVAPSTRTR